MNEKHWLVRPETIRKLWFGLGAILIVLVLLDFFVTHEAKFTVDGWFSFYAIFGFIACIILVYGSKALGLIFKRPENYYDFEIEEPKPKEESHR